MEAGDSKTSLRLLKWTFKSMLEVHAVVNNLLRHILMNERSKRWRKVVDAYERLLWVIDIKHFPKDYEPPASYNNLLYECHFHLGLALQRLDQHKKSIVHYTQAMKAVSIPKCGCQAGCIANSCMLTPLYARRAFAHCMTDSLSNALRDIEDLTLLDSKNPDVYCVRALVHTARKEEKQAIQDLDYGLKLNPQHSGCKIVQRALCNPPSIMRRPEVQSLDNVDSFLHPFAMDFYDRMLYTLMVPHKLTVVELTPDKPNKKQIELEIRRSSSADPATKSSSVDPFRCGTVAPGDNVLAAKRRRDYGEALRKNVVRPQTAQEFLERLKNDVRRRQYIKTSERSSARSTGSASSYRTCTSRSSHSKFTFETPTSYSIPVFQSVNVKTAPRMYYRPWQGDRLPKADLPHPETSPAFY
ncbi:tpr repeat [Biomphalaria glabrata]